MKGRAPNTDFINKFIQDCVKLNISSPDKICALALEKINFIDFELKRINDLKAESANLKDVLNQFGYKSCSERNFLSFSEIEGLDNSYIQILCSFINGNDNCSLSDLLKTNEFSSKEKTVFYLKKLAEAGVIVFGDKISKGDKWFHYMTLEKKS
jgi:hypothetical protein